MQDEQIDFYNKVNKLNDDSASSDGDDYFDQVIPPQNNVRKVHNKDS